MLNMIRVCPKRKIDGGTLAGGAAQTITIAERIDVSQFNELMLVARLHRNNIGNGATMTVKIVHDYFDSNDPGTIFLTTASVLATLAFQQATAIGTGQMQVATGFGPRFAAVQIVLQQAAGQVALDADISIDINFKINNGNGVYRPMPNTFVGYRY